MSKEIRSESVVEKTTTYKKDWRITDIAFFGSIFIVLLIVCICIIFDIKEPKNITYYWLGFLMLIVIPKTLLPRSKFVRWLEKKRW